MRAMYEKMIKFLTDYSFEAEIASDRKRWDELANTWVDWINEQYMN